MKLLATIFTFTPFLVAALADVSVFAVSSRQAEKVFYHTGVYKNTLPLVSDGHLRLNGTTTLGFTAQPFADSDYRVPIEIKATDGYHPVYKEHPCPTGKRQVIALINDIIPTVLSRSPYDNATLTLVDAILDKNGRLQVVPIPDKFVSASGFAFIQVGNKTELHHHGVVWVVRAEDTSARRWVVRSWSQAGLNDTLKSFNDPQVRGTYGIRAWAT